MFSFRTLLSHGAAAFLTCAVMPSVAAAQDGQTPPYREIWNAGGVTVIAIQDVYRQMPASIFKGAATEQERAPYFTGGKTEGGINVFVLRMGGKIALVDAGGGPQFQPPGKLPLALAALGIAPQDIDLVLITHAHSDHIGGLLTQEGKRAFPKARVLLAQPELDAWLTLAEKDPANAGAAMVKAVVAAYGADVQTFAFGAAVLPGVIALDAAGHTPGHTAFEVTAGGKSLLLVGDLIHAMPLQFALPDECAAYDMDMPKAIAARKRIFALAEHSQTPMSGVHFPFTHIVGTVKKDGKGWKFAP
ncbi:MAG: MBL fold metallo-hydrolase [Burkholderiaceae bacterium]|jgi:glyoxylase-like metal-dependent hydrolase (beta-lactamase superfamily II)|nr:MBL fold metallo-hydrolase [Burkholderiaceae bacterium]